LVRNRLRAYPDRLYLPAGGGAGTGWAKCIAGSLRGTPTVKRLADQFLRTGFVVSVVVISVARKNRRPPREDHQTEKSCSDHHPHHSRSLIVIPPCQSSPLETLCADTVQCVAVPPSHTQAAPNPCREAQAEHTPSRVSRVFRDGWHAAPMAPRAALRYYTSVVRDLYTH
jgi:hypothetical protein